MIEVEHNAERRTESRPNFNVLNEARDNGDGFKHLQPNSTQATENLVKAGTLPNVGLFDSQAAEVGPSSAAENATANTMAPQSAKQEGSSAPGGETQTGDGADNSKVPTDSVSPNRPEVKRFPPGRDSTSPNSQKSLETQSEPTGSSGNENVNSHTEDTPTNSHSEDSHTNSQSADKHSAPGGTDQNSDTNSGGTPSGSTEALRSLPGSTGGAELAPSTNGGNRLQL